MNSTARQFHLGAILSITTPYLVSLDGMDSVQDLVSFMVGAELGTIATRFAADDVAPHLREQLPFLKEITLEGTNAGNWRDKLDASIEQFGEFHDVRPLAVQS